VTSPISLSKAVSIEAMPESETVSVSLPLSCWTTSPTLRKRGSTAE
jgi:hypothetical protein